MNLVICTTSLQILIAQKIIEKYHNEPFELCVIKISSDSKIEHYIKRIEKMACKKYVIKHNQYGLHWLFLLCCKIIWIFRFKKYDDVFFAKFDEIFDVLFGAIKFKRLFSFDDGADSITKSAKFNKTRHYRGRFLLEVFRLIFRPKPINKNDVLMHYTIFDNFTDDVLSHKRIKLFEFNLPNSSHKNKEIRLFIGQPIFEGKLEQNKIVLEAVLDKFKIDYYLPHPREEYRLDNVIYVNTNLLIEEYIVNELLNNPDTSYTLYGFFSTALFTLCGINGINLKAIRIKDDLTLLKYKDLYEKLEQIGIEVLDINAHELNLKQANGRYCKYVI
ncbi:hypothetical protein KDE13_08500 [Campylobacter sp. faydin G-140]|uniref:glycosyltransferase family 52 n=1 Tax=Campylobacter anatolicus TaxID=2829105 RepID=UPI001B9D94FE|nr:glycosyltransferase family 52 [Campylobacter anatolicus]MBR8466372.1 hypothetical protein [Campylobacter anatolicus]